MSSDELYLPDECWESVIKILLLDHYRYLEPLSLVSKQFLSITNRLRTSLTISDHTLIYAPRLLTRFPILSSLRISGFSGDFRELLRQIRLSVSPQKLHSLNVSNCSLIWEVEEEKEEDAANVSCCSFSFSFLKMMMMVILYEFNLVPKPRRPVLRFRIPIRIIPHYFPFLEELDITFLKGPVSDIDIKALSLALPRLRKVNLSGNRFINNSSLFHLCNNCQFLEQVVIFAFNTEVLSCDGIASAIRTRPNLTSLSLSSADYLTKLSPHFIASILSLKSLSCIDLPYSTISDDMLFCIAEEGLPLRKLVLRGCHEYTYAGIFCLLSNCKLVQHLDLRGNRLLKDEHISNLSVFLPNLISINLRACEKLTNSSFFALTSQCPLLTEINMAITSMGVKRSGVVDSLMDLVVNSQMKSLYLSGNRSLTDEDIKIFAFICPNLQLLNLSTCSGISKGVVEALKRCPKIRDLNLSGSSRVQLLGVNFQVPILEELDLSYSSIDDEALFIISQSFCWLLRLDIEYCSEITTKGLRHVVENCKRLREINLNGCFKVDANFNFIHWMVVSRPSLRKVLTHHFIDFTEKQKELFLSHGCVVSE